MEQRGSHGQREQRGEAGERLAAVLVFRRDVHGRGGGGGGGVALTRGRVRGRIGPGILETQGHSIPSLTGK